MKRIVSNRDQNLTRVLPTTQDDVVQLLLVSCRQLTTLDLAGCSLVTAAACVSLSWQPSSDSGNEALSLSDERKRWRALRLRGIALGDGIALFKSSSTSTSTSSSSTSSAVGGVSASSLSSSSVSANSTSSSSTATATMTNVTLLLDENLVKKKRIVVLIIDRHDHLLA